MLYTPRRIGVGLRFTLLGTLAFLMMAPLPAQANTISDQEWSQEMEIAQVRELIEKNGWDWEAGPTSINAIPPSERTGIYGYVPPAEDDIRNRRASVVEALPTEDLPAQWDWRALGGMTLPRQQGGCGSCWAFAAVGALESIYKITTGTEQLFSVQHCISCNEYGDGCNGGNMTTCYDLWTWFGSVPRNCMPYVYPWNAPCTQNECEVPIRVTDYSLVPYGTDNLKTAVMTHPIAVTMYASYLLNNYSGGCFNGPSGSINHAVLCCGWDDYACGGQGAWLMKNSWGTYWGEGGYCWVQYGSSSFGGQGRLLDVWFQPDQLVAYRAHEVLDAGNGCLDPNETAPVAITVTNYGYSSATGVSGVLTCLTPGVTVVDDQATFPDMARGESGTSQGDHFTIRAEPGTQLGTLIEFQLEITCSGGSDASDFSDFVGPVTVVYANDFEGSTAGWIHGPISGSDDWQLGSARVFDGHWDPPLAASGSQYFGNDLNGEIGAWDGLYPATSHNYLQSPVIDCSVQSGVHLTFNRWLASEHSGWDVASVSVLGTEVWRNIPAIHHTDFSWVPVTLDISDLADGVSNVTVRFDMHSDDYWQFGGWNIDDFQVVATNAGSAAIGDRQLASPLGLSIRSTPNPFVTVTGIKLAIPDGVTQADLEIFDATGRVVRTLHHGSIEPGGHHFTWTGKDASGQTVPAGTYYCRAQSGQHSVVTKVIRVP